MVRSAGLTVDDPAFAARVRDLASRDPRARSAGRAHGRDLVRRAGGGGRRGGRGPRRAGRAGRGPAAVKAAEAAAQQAAGQAAALVSADRRTTILPVTMAVPSGEVDEHMTRLYDIVSGADGQNGFTVVLTGTGAWERDASEIAESDLRRGEAIGIPIALLILVVVFASVVAALVPLALGVVAIIVGAALTALLGEGFMVSVFALNIVTMMGLAVGIDYTLFILSRFREELAAGRAVPDAVGRSAATASRAVLFSGMTVVLALCGMLVVPFTIFTSLGAGAILVVAAAVAAALTLLPAVLGLLGAANALRLPLAVGPPRERAAAAARPAGAARPHGRCDRVAGRTAGLPAATSGGGSGRGPRPRSCGARS